MTLLANRAISGQHVPMAALLAALVLVHGVVMRGPTKPVCEMATPCSERAAGVLLVFNRAGTTRRVRTDARGRYTVTLRRGTYLVHVSPAPRIGRGIEPATIVVYGPRRVDFLIDTGIR